MDEWTQNSVSDSASESFRIRCSADGYPLFAFPLLYTTRFAFSARMDGRFYCFPPKKIESGFPYLVIGIREGRVNSKDEG